MDGPTRKFVSIHQPSKSQQTLRKNGRIFRDQFGMAATLKIDGRTWERYRRN